MSNLLKEIPTTQLLKPWAMLRPVRESSLEYLELVDSIRQDGLFKSLLVRPHPTRTGYYEIIDGMWRFSACCELDILEIPCIIKVDVTTDEKFLALQIAANAISYETHPVEFAEQMQRMLDIREYIGSPMSLKELAGELNKSASWVSTRLKLLKLCPEARDSVRNEEINLTKAIALAKINSPFYQLEYLVKAKELKTRDFELEIGHFLNMKREEKAKARREFRDEITLKPRLQSMDSMLIELDRLENLSQIIVQRGLTTAREGAIIALEWALNLHEEGRGKQVKEIRHKLSDVDRREIIGRQRYEELKHLSELKQQRAERQRVSFTTLGD